MKLVTFRSLMTKDDDLFLRYARKALGFDFESVMQEAKEAFNSHSRPSEGKRAANLVILNALKEIGEHHWRTPKDNEPPAQKIEVKPAALPQKKQERKWKGKSILEMAGERK